MKKIKKKNKAVRKKVTADRVKYQLNEKFEFFDELRNLVLKSIPAEKNRLVGKIMGLGRIRLAIISGIFLNNKDSLTTLDSEVDLFIVGDGINNSKLTKLLKSLEAEVGKEIKFGIMEKDEFIYRHGMFDRFVRVLLEGPHEKLINKLGL